MLWQKKLKITCSNIQREKKDVIIFLKDNPWLVAIIGGPTAGILAGVVVFHLPEHRVEKIARTALIAQISNASEFLEKNMTDYALAIYQDMLKIVSVKESVALNSYVRDKEENLSRAITAYKENN